MLSKIEYSAKKKKIQINLYYTWGEKLKWMKINNLVKISLGIMFENIIPFAIHFLLIWNGYYNFVMDIIND